MDDTTHTHSSRTLCSKRLALPHGDGFDGSPEYSSDDNEDDNDNDVGRDNTAHADGNDHDSDTYDEYGRDDEDDDDDSDGKDNTAQIGVVAAGPVIVTAYCK